MSTKILIFNEKHGDRYFDASTDEKLHAACLKILRERVGPEGYWQFINPVDWESEWVQKYIEGWDIEDAEIETIAIESVQKQVRAQRAKARQRRNEYLRADEQWARARVALEENDGEAAYQILQERDGGEYEDFTIEYLEDALDLEDVDA